MLSGAFWIDKPAGLTSSDVVVRLKIALTKNGYCEKGFKIGHGGTLDPFATGTLVVLVGEATKLADTYLHSIKTYTGIITLGTKTDTADLTGEAIEQSPIPDSTIEWQNLADSFCQNEYWQTPPMYSAKKQGGRTLHELARKGIEVERKAILKKIHHYFVKPLSKSELSFEVRCESGTYVRVLAEDLAQKAGTVAHLKTLVRVQTSDVVLDQCEALDKVLSFLSTKNPIDQSQAFHPMPEVGTHLHSVTVSTSEAKEILNGYPPATHQLIERISTEVSSGARRDFAHAPRYSVARIESGFPIALFERTSEKDSIVKPSYRLQRVLRPES